MDTAHRLSRVITTCMFLDGIHNQHTIRQQLGLSLTNRTKALSERSFLLDVQLTQLLTKLFTSVQTLSLADHEWWQDLAQHHCVPSLSATLSIAQESQQRRETSSMWDAETI